MFAIEELNRIVKLNNWTGCVGASHGELGGTKRRGWAQDNRTDSQGDSDDDLTLLRLYCTHVYSQDAAMDAMKKSLEAADTGPPPR